ncbi:hypothetical protein FBU59_000342 [Linderina macrospora]|uniref:Uncharacterized protein n=1 Tax=Linderina macrospora TaxID=4868 RepID=A0ACC1JHE2_9FUNG|nr:hypothetical protein FBU59_000342 [Linderina macrospora]
MLRSASVALLIITALTSALPTDDQLSCIQAWWSQVSATLYTALTEVAPQLDEDGQRQLATLIDPESQNLMAYPSMEEISLLPMILDPSQLKNALAPYC